MIIVLCIIGAVLTWVPASVVIARNISDSNKLDQDDLVLGVAIGALAATIWPLFWLAILVYFSARWLSSSHDFGSVRFK